MEQENKNLFKGTHQNVITMMTPRTPLKNVAHIMAFGSLREASFSSSDMCAPASGPISNKTRLVSALVAARAIAFSGRESSR